MIARIVKLALGVGIVLVVVAGLWLQLREGEGGRGAAATEHAEAVAGAAEADGTAELVEPALPSRAEGDALVAPDAHEARARREAAAERAGDELPLEHQSFALEGALWIDVAVALPRGLPADDAPALVAVVPEAGAARDFVDGFEDMDEDDLDEIGRAVTDEGLREAEDGGDWSRRALAPLVRLPVPAGAGHALVVLDSRYLRAPPVLVALAESRTVALAPELGGRLTGRCVAPPGHALAAAEIEVGARARDGERGFAAIVERREIDVQDDLTFELRALQAGTELALEARCAGLVGPAELAIEVEAGRHHEVVVAFTPGAVLEGSVRGEGAPVAGATVTALSAATTTPFAWRGPPSVESGPDGAFRLAGVAPGDVRVTVQRQGWRDAEARELRVAEGEVVRGLDFVLDPGLRIRGTVVWPDGKAADGAEVQALRVRGGGWMEPVADATSGADGAFVLGGLSAGAVVLMAHHEPPGDGGSAGARDASTVGHTVIRDGEELSWSFETSGRAWRARLDGIEPDGIEPVLRLEAPLVVEGRVVDDAGAPVVECRISAHPAGEPEFTPERVDGFRTTEEGRFSLGVARAGTWTFQAHAGDSERKSAPVTLPVPLGAAALELVVPRGSALAGRVVDPSGRPVAGAAIRVTPPGEFLPGRFGSDQEGEESAADGTFALADVASGSSITAAHDGWAPSEPFAVELAPGEAREGVELRLRRGARITGEVRDAEGAPRRGQNVNCASGPAAAMAFGWGGERSTTTDADGRFVFEHVEPGKVVVTAMPDMQTLMEQSLAADGADAETAFVELMSDMQTATLEVADGGEAHVVLGAKPKRPVRVHGRVTEGGRAVEAGQVYAFAEGGALLAGMELARLGAGGRYELVLDRPGDWVFAVSVGEDPSGMGTPFPVEVPEADEHEQDLALPTGRIAGVVVGPDGPAAGVALRLVSDAGLMGFDDLADSHNVHSDAHGEFAFPRVRSGRYSIQVGGDFQGFDGRDPLHAQRVVDGIEVTGSRGVEGLRIRLEPPGKLSGVVRDAAGRPAAGLAIFVRDAEGRAISASSCTTDASGRFTYPGIAPGSVTCSARGRDLATPESAPIEIRAGETTSVELTASPGTYLVVALLDGDREVRARLHVADESGRRVDDLRSLEDFAAFFGEGTSSRERRVGPLAPGKYTLTATSLDGKDARKTVVVEPGAPERSVKLRLR